MDPIVIIIVVFGIAILLKMVIFNKPEDIEKNSALAVNAIDWSQDGDFDFDIVGESKYQVTLKMLAGKHGTESAEKYLKAHIILENHNKYDSNAVRVDIENKPVGYFDRQNAVEYRDFLKRRNIKAPYATCDALITGGFRKEDGSLASYGVRLDMQDL